MARSRGRRTDYDWLGMRGTVAAIDLAVGAGGNGSEGLAFFTKQTVTRIRGFIAVELDPTAVNERALIAVGIGVASSDAEAAGGAGLPDPNTDIGYPWIWHGFFYVSSLQDAAIGADFLIDRREVDSKAMRRVGLDQSLFLIAQVAVSTDQGGNADLTYGLRVLTGA